MSEPATRTMTADEAALADAVYAAIQESSNYSERSQQSADFRMGISDLGWCQEKVRRMIAGIPEPVTDKLPAFIGTALGDHMEQACMSMWPHAIRQAEVSVLLQGDGGNYEVGGHPDLILPDRALVVDFKSTRGLGSVRRTGPSRQQQFQRHCYALGAHEAGYFDVELDEVQVANVWIDRAADDREVFVQMEPYSPEIVDEAAMWVDDVVYAYLHEQPAMKEPAREVCAKTCGHFATCRALDTDVEGLLSDDQVLVAVDMYQDAMALEKQARQLKDQAKAALTGVTGSTGKFSVRWVHVNSAEVAFTRGAYERLDVREVK
jgi:hypothetical protein